MTKCNLLVAARKSLAVISAASVVMSYGMTGLLSASAAEADKKTSGAVTDASVLEIYDKYGNLINDHLNLYIDNSPRAGQNTSDTFIVVMKNDDKEALSGFADDFLLFEPSLNGDKKTKMFDSDYYVLPEENYPSYITPSENSVAWEVVISCCGWETKKNDKDPLTGEPRNRYYEVPYVPGEVSFSVGAESGTVRRVVDLHVLEPTNDINVYWNDPSKKSAIKFSDPVYNVHDGYETITEHEYDIPTSLVTAHPSAPSEYLDHIGWHVTQDKSGLSFRKTVDGTIKYFPAALEISSKGQVNADVYKPLENNPLWLVAYAMPTMRVEYEHKMAKKALDDGKIDQAKYDEMLSQFTTDPYTGEITDRPFGIIGTKKYNDYALNANKDNNYLVEENEYGDYLKRDKNGKTTTVAIEDNQIADKDHFHASYTGNGSDYLVYNINYKLVGYRPTYVPLYNVPKYIRVYNYTNNPAKEIKFSKVPGAQITGNETTQIRGSMMKGETANISISPTPSYPNEQAGTESGVTDVFTWQSLNPDIVEIVTNATRSPGDVNASIKAKKAGTARIRVQGENSSVSADCFITVNANATNISIQQTSLTVKIGDTATNVATLLPDDANEEIEWVSGNTSIVQVSGKTKSNFTNKQEVEIKGVSAGSVSVTGTTKNTKRTVKFTVTVTPKNLAKNISVTTSQNGKSKTVSDTETLFTNQDITFDARLIGDNNVTPDDKVVWTISDSNHAYVTVTKQTSEQLTLHGIARGKVTVTAAAADNKSVSKTFTVQVKKGCATATITRSNGKSINNPKNLPVGGTLSLAADLRTSLKNTPYDHDDTVSSWASSNTDVVTVDKNGNVKGVKNGLADITVKTASGVTGKLTINVFTTSSIEIGGATVKPDGSILTTIDLDKELKGSKTLTATVRDEDDEVVSNVDCVWKSSNPTVAVVSSSGVVTGLDVGTTDITVTCGTKSQTCKVTVYATLQAADSVTIAPYTYSPLVTIYEPKPTITVGKHTLVLDKDYTVKYDKNTSVGKATMTITGKGFYKNSISSSYQINKRSINDGTVSLKYIENQECTGSPIIPDISVIFTDPDSKQTISLKENTDYTIKLSNNTKPGEASITVSGKGNYSDSLNRTFTIYCDHKVLKNAVVLEQATYEKAGLEKGTCAACGEKDVTRVIPMIPHSDNAATELSFLGAEYGLSKGETIQIQPVAKTPNPQLAPTDTFRWVSDNEKVVTVDQDGKITGKSFGKAVITVYGETEGVEASCTVAVLDKITEIAVNPAEPKTRVDVDTIVKAEINPAKSTDELVWTSEDPSIATVTPSETDKMAATITGVSVGTTKIIVSGRYSDISKEIEINVEEKNASDILVISTMFDDKEEAVTNGSTYKIFSNQDVVFDAAIANGSGEKSDDVTVWQITENDGNYVTIPDHETTEDFVGDKITIHGTSEGSVKVTAFPQSNPSLKTTFTLQVTKRSDNLKIVDELGDTVNSRSIDVNDKLTLTADMTTNNPNDPYNHGDEVYEWTSSDPEVATIDAAGNIEPKKNGKTVITVMTRSKQTKSVNLTVFTTSNVYITKGVDDTDVIGADPSMTIVMDKNFEGKKALTATTYDETETAVSNVMCKWSSSNEKVATVDEYGVVTAHSVGESTISVQSGSKMQICNLTVTAPVTSIKHDPIEDYVYTPGVEAYEPDPVFTAGDTTLVKGTDYTLEYSDNTKPGTATMKVTGLGFYTGTQNITYKINKRDLTDPAVKISTVSDQNYTGEEIRPEITITCEGTTLVEGQDYTVSYSKNKDIGTATITISAVSKSNYTGKAVVEFKIVDPNGNPDGPKADVICGDVDGDGDVTSADALAILRASSGLSTLTAAQTTAADVDGDGDATSSDALQVLRYSSGLPAGESIGKKI